MQFRLRVLVVFLCLLVALSLVSCQSITGLLQPTPAPTPTATPTPTPTATPEPTPTPTPYHEIFPITFGLSTELSYQNEFFNVKLDLNKNWFTAASAELDLANGFPMEVPKDVRKSEYLDYLPKGLPVQEYSAHLHTGLGEISILVNNAKEAMAAYDSVAAYHEGNIELIRGALIDAGATMLRDEHTTTVLAGTEQSCWFFSYDSYGYTTYNAQVIFQQGDYTMNIYVSTIGTDHTADILALFTPYAE
jgi:hypothetical protein